MVVELLIDPHKSSVLPSLAQEQRQVFDIGIITRFLKIFNRYKENRRRKFRRKIQAACDRLQQYRERLGAFSLIILSSYRLLATASVNSGVLSSVAPFICLARS